MRAGRFDRQIYVDLPDLNERKAIFEVHLRPLKTDEELDTDFLAKPQGFQEQILLMSVMRLLLL